MKIKSAKYALSAATLALMFGLTAPAWAALEAVSGVAVPVLVNGNPADVAVDADNGFPIWYQDFTGLRLELCLDQNGFCLTEEPDTANPISFPDNFGPEAFWWMAETEVSGNGVTGLLVLALEAAFANEEPVEGDQVAFARIRIRIDVPTPGTYTVTHPFGVATYNVAAVDVPGGGGANEINETQDIGNFLLPGRPGPPDNANYLLALVDGPGDPEVPGDSVPNISATGASIGPFLTRVGGTVTDTVTGNVYLASPLTPVNVTGSPDGNNLFRIAGPPGTVQTALFTLMGKVSGCGDGNLAPVSVADRAGTAVGTPVVINVLANDHNDTAQVDGAVINPASVAIATNPASGTAVVNPDGTVTFTPAAGVVGPITFTYTVADFCGLVSPQATVTVLVEDMQLKADYRTRTGRWSLTGSGNVRNLTADTGTTFFSKLTGAQEVPAVTTPGSGEISVILGTDGTLGTVIDYTLTYSSLTDVTQAHIHNGAVGVNGPVNVFLCSNLAPPAGVPVPPACPATAGTVTGTLSAADFILAGAVETFDQLVAAIQAGGTYANVHTVATPTGEIRGQVGRNVVSLRAGATGPAIGAAEVQTDGTWGFIGKSAVSPGAAATVQAESAAGTTVTRSLRKR